MRRTFLKKRFGSVKKQLIILACLLSAVNLFAREGVLKGKVSDARSQETLIGVSIYVKEQPCPY